MARQAGHRQGAARCRLESAHTQVELAGVTKYPCRCSYWLCRKRKTLAKHPSEYVRSQPACWNCGRRRWTVDRYRRMREHQKYACTCGGIEGLYNWAGPHRRGSLFCVHGKATEARVAERMGWSR
jgi:hypothetical protein